MTSNDTPIDLFRLLPAVYQIDDEAAGGALRALLGLLSEQANRLKADIAGLWDDFFVETAADWVIPYIGELVGNTPLHPAAGSRRADVAKTIYYRRRKGTLPMLEELARDVTGWGARAVAFFELLAWAQNVNHIRATPAPNPRGKNPPACDRVGTVNLRNRDAVNRIGGPFDVVAHTVDVRLPNPLDGWYNVPNVGFFLYRLQSYPVLGDARPSAAWPTGFHFSPLGNDIPLFTRPLPERDETGLATELHVPGPIRPLAFAEDVSAYRRKYAPVPPAAPPPSDYVGRIEPDPTEPQEDRKTVALLKNGSEKLSALTVCPANLGQWASPPAGQVAVDVVRGRIAFPASQMPTTGLQVWYSYGFSANVGGGPYDRRRPPVSLGQTPPDRPDFVGTPDAFPSPGVLKPVSKLAGNTIQGEAGGAVNTVVQVEDSRTYTENLTLSATGRELVIQARNFERPVLLGNISITGSGVSRVRLDGFWIAGKVSVTGDLAYLELAHCTLVPGLTLGEDGTPAQPGQSSLTVANTNTKLQVTLDRCLTGPLEIPAVVDRLIVRDSVIDSPGWQAAGAVAAVGGPGGQVGPATELDRCTVFGAVAVKELTLASEVIFTTPVIAQRRQSGCVRFSYVPDGSQTPRRYRCQPDLVLEGVTDPAEQARRRLRVTPRFTATRYGRPGYAQLNRSCAPEIRLGAESGTEMGAFAHLMQPQREANLRTRLDEYLPAGLTPALIFVT